MKRVAILIFVCVAGNAQAARFLFDAGHAQTAGNADWIIDADVRNIFWNNSGTFTLTGSDSNAQRIPTPAASGIISNTLETYWDGGISAWAVDLVKRGHSVETLPAGATFTFNTANSQDLTNYDVVVVDEPNILFTLVEKQALLNFVTNGGSLFMIADHSNSDRNNDGFDSPEIWMDFLTNNLVANNPFGIVFPSSTASGINTFNHNIVGDPILNGPVGLVTNTAYFSGNRFQIDHTKNPTVISHMWFGAASDSNNFCAVASLGYGNGRVVVVGDSSPIEDGTGDPGDTIFNGYTGDLGETNRIWILNASEWLSAPFAPAMITNSWTNSVSGKWEVGANWSSGTPSSADVMDFITNAANKTITIDATTTNTPTSLTISNLTLSGPTGSTNTLSLTNVGLVTPLRVLNLFTFGSNGVLLVTNSALRVDGGFDMNGGTATVTTGSIAITNAGNTGSIDVRSGSMTIKDGAVAVDQLVATNFAGRFSLNGGSLTPGSTIAHDQTIFAVGAGPVPATLNIARGIHLYVDGLYVGTTATSTGTVWMTGGSLAVTNGSNDLRLGNMGGSGRLVMSNGTMRTKFLTVGGPFSTGTFTMAGGTNLVSVSMFVADSTSSTGAVWMTGGELDVSNNFATIYIAFFFASGQMTVSNGLVRAYNVVIGSAGSAQGTLNLFGGTETVYSSMVLGDCGNASVGTVNIAGGSLYVTNAAHNAVLDIRNGTLTFNGGVLQVDNLVMTNSCALFIHSAGALTISNLVLSANLDADGDGIPNGYEQSHGLDPLNPADAALDGDHDGFSNLQEYQAGTNPNDPASSPFRITDAHVEGNSVRVIWVPGTGTTNALQGTSGAPDGSYRTNGFVTIFTVTNAAGSTTNYLDVGAATNSPSRYYRVRLVP